ncbi:hypothetical protein FO519_008995, partial [Halicephalobus sp. NKZ332]
KIQHFPDCYLKFDKLQNKIVVNDLQYSLPMDILKTPLDDSATNLQASGHKKEFEFIMKNCMTSRLKKMNLRFKMFIRIFEVRDFIAKVPQLETLYMEVETDEKDSAAYSRMAEIIEKELIFLKEITFIIKDQRDQVFLHIHKNNKINNIFSWITVKTTEHGLEYLMDCSLGTGVKVVTMVLDFFLKPEDFRKLLRKISDSRIIEFAMAVDGTRGEEQCSVHKQIFNEWMSSRPLRIWNYKITIAECTFHMTAKMSFDSTRINGL